MRARELFETPMAPTAPTTKPGTKPGIKPPARPGQPRPTRFPDPFKTPWEKPGTKHKPKACMRTETVRRRAAQVVDHLLEVKMYATTPKPYPGVQPAPSKPATQAVPPVRTSAGQGKSGWQICCKRCGRPTTTGSLCPTCKPTHGGTTPAPVQ